MTKISLLYVTWFRLAIQYSYIFESHFFSFWNICDSNTREADHDALNLFTAEKHKICIP